MKTAGDVADQHFDLALAGAGIAGLALASALAQSTLALRIVVVDEDPDSRDDRTLSYFSARPLPIAALARRVFESVVFRGGGLELDLPLARYRYASLHGQDFRAAARRRIDADPRITLVAGHVERVEEDAFGARLWVDGHAISARWIFDSRFEAARPAIRRQDTLVQRFLGWEIELAAPVLDPRAAHLFDFARDRAAPRFHYVLPFSDRVALVELVTFGAPARQEELAAYIARRWPGTAYRILRREGGESLLTAAPFARTALPHVVTIGLAGGLLRPSTGYALTRILDDAQAMVRGLEAGRHPLAFVRPAGIYRVFDAVLLRLIATRAGRVAGVFTALFARNPIERVLRFLDEHASAWDLLRMMWSLPKWLFVRAFASWLALRLGVAKPFRDWPRPRPRKLLAR